MAKWRGYIGYGVQTEVASGVWKDVITRKFARGDVITMVRNELGSIEQGQKVNHDVTFRNQISVVMDAYAQANIMNLRYVEWMGVKWKITSVNVARPRITLTIGEIWVDGDAIESSSTLGSFILGQSSLG